jgi:alpha-ketoglutarate-dependent taurine dioxygenase
MEGDSMTITVRRIGPGFAADISGVDLSTPLSGDNWERIDQAFLEHKVIAFHDQALSATEFHAFGERFGTIEPYTVEMYRHAERPGIPLLSDRTELGRPKGIKDAGSHWHSDYSYKAVPAKATMLYALETPDEGGDTLFGDLAAAYQALPEATKASLPLSSTALRHRALTSQELISGFSLAMENGRGRPVTACWLQTSRQRAPANFSKEASRCFPRATSLASRSCWTTIRFTNCGSSGTK